MATLVGHKISVKVVGDAHFEELLGQTAGQAVGPLCLADGNFPTDELDPKRTTEWLFLVGDVPGWVQTVEAYARRMTSDGLPYAVFIILGNHETMEFEKLRHLYEGPDLQDWMGRTQTVEKSRKIQTLLQRLLPEFPTDENGDLDENVHLLLDYAVSVPVQEGCVPYEIHGCVLTGHTARRGARYAAFCCSQEPGCRLTRACEELFLRRSEEQEHDGQRQRAVLMHYPPSKCSKDMMPWLYELEPDVIGHGHIHRDAGVERYSLHKSGRQPRHTIKVNGAIYDDNGSSRSLRGRIEGVMEEHTDEMDRVQALHDKQLFGVSMSLISLRLPVLYCQRYSGKGDKDGAARLLDKALSATRGEDPDLVLARECIDRSLRCDVLAAAGYDDNRRLQMKLHAMLNPNVIMYCFTTADANDSRSGWLSFDPEQLATSADAAAATAADAAEAAAIGAALDTLMADDQMGQHAAVLHGFSVVELWRLRRVSRAFRRWGTAALAALPRVVAVGGDLDTFDDDDPEETAGVEVLDLSTLRWSSGVVPPLPEPRCQHTACAHGDGRVVVAGGYDSTHPRTALQWVPGAAGWAAMPDMAKGRWGHAAAPLTDGRTMVIGGRQRYDDGGGQVDRVEVLPGDGSGWSAVASMRTTRNGAAAATLPCGKVMVAGGYNGNGVALETAELWDPATGDWSDMPSMTEARFGAGCCVLPSGRVAVVGGEGRDREALRDGEAFDPEEQTWHPLPPMRHRRRNHAVVAIAGGLLAMGGERQIPGLDPFFIGNELFDETSGRWFMLPHQMVERRTAVCAASLPAAALAPQPARPCSEAAAAQVQ